METLTDLIKQAIEHEVKAGAFYDKAAEITENDEARMVFLELVNVEDGHCGDLIKIFTSTDAISEDDIRQYYEQLCDSVQADDIEMENYTVVKQGGLEDVLKMAVSFEQKAIQTYTELYQKLSNDELKTFCTKLLEEEKQHEKTLTTLLNNLNMEIEEYPAL